MKDPKIFPKEYRHPNSSTAGRRSCTFMLETLELDENSTEDMCLILESFTDTYFKVSKAESFVIRPLENQLSSSVLLHPPPPPPSVRQNPGRRAQRCCCSATARDVFFSVRSGAVVSQSAL
jgi:hypothetical protein